MTFARNQHGDITPFNPSRSAAARVRDVLPIPEECPHCGGPVEICLNSAIYGGRTYGEYPWVLRCVGDCDAHVGFHPFTAIPLGTLATGPMRTARQAAKAEFNPTWQGGRMTRSQAYGRLAAAMRMPVSQCHIGWFTVEQCEQVIEICRKW